MPLGVRDILLVIRAKDQASRVIRDVGLAFDALSGEQELAAKRSIAAGAALLGVGVAMTAVGVLGVAALKKMTDAAIAYNNASALTLTQTDGLGASVQDIADIGLRVASSIAAPLDQLQPALYDIFSSMEVNLPQAESLLTQFAKAAVAGGVDVQTAGRATIAIMNAYKIPVENASEVMDFQFQLVRKGVGTYEEFASSLGRVLPSARRAGQDLDSLGGTMAFLTRNGLSANMAATSAARAFDNLTKPSVIENMQKYGVAVLDSSGSVRQMNDIATDLGKALDGLSDADKAKALENIFKGAGNNVQARRFWDLAIRNFQELDGLTDDMIAKSGSLQDAYDIMFQQPAAQSQLLQNNLDALKISLGQALIPMFSEAVKWLTKVTQWFNNLSSSTKALIAHILLITSAALIFIGIMFIIAGAFKMLFGAIKLAGGIFQVFKLLLLSPELLIVIAILLAIAAAAYLIYRNWDTLKAYWEEYWPKFKKVAEDVWEWMQKTWADMWPRIKEIASSIWDWMQSTWEDLWPKIKATAKTVWEWLQKAWDKVWKTLKTTWEWLQDNVPGIAAAIWGAIQTAWNAIVTATAAVVGAIQTFWGWLQTAYNWVKDNFGPGFLTVWNAIKDNVGPIIEDIILILQGLWENWLVPLWGWFMDYAWPTIVTVWNGIYQVISVVIQQIIGILQTWWSFVVAVWNGVKDDILPIILTTWTTITDIFDGALKIIKGIFDIFAGIFQLDWSKMWEGIKSVASGAWEILESIVKQGWAAVQLAWDTAIAVAKAAWQTFWDALPGILDGAWAIIQAAISLAWNTVQTIWETQIEIIKQIWQGFWDALSATVHAVVDPIINLVQGLIDKVKEIVDLLPKIKLPGGGGGILGGIADLADPWGIFHAAGGGLEPGRAIVRNEFGRELFVPSVRGTLLTAGQTQKLVNGVGATVAGQTRVINVHSGAFQVNITGDNVEGNRRMVQEELEKLLVGLRRA